MGLKNKALLEAHIKGYRVSEDGQSLKTVNNTLYPKIFVDGYPMFEFRMDGKKLNVSWHRLQAYQKYGDRLFEKGIVVRHLNSIKTDCSVDNIVIGTEKENSYDKPEEDRLKYSLNAVDKIRKYNATEVRKYHVDNGNSAIKTMTEFGMTSKGTLHYVLKKAKHS